MIEIFTTSCLTGEVHVLVIKCRRSVKFFPSDFYFSTSHSRACDLLMMKETSIHAWHTRDHEEQVDTKGPVNIFVVPTIPIYEVLPSLFTQHSLLSALFRVSMEYFS